MFASMLFKLVPTINNINSLREQKDLINFYFPWPITKTTLFFPPPTSKQGIMPKLFSLPGKIWSRQFLAKVASFYSYFFAYYFFSLPLSTLRSLLKCFLYFSARSLILFSIFLSIYCSFVNFTIFWLALPISFLIEALTVAVLGLLTVSTFSDLFL